MTKLSERKVLQFTGFHPSVGKTFTFFASSVWKVMKKAIAQLSIRRDNFHDSSKIRETFLSLNFCCLQDIKENRFYFHGNSKVPDTIVCYMLFAASNK